MEAAAPGSEARPGEARSCCAAWLPERRRRPLRHRRTVRADAPAAPWRWRALSTPWGCAEPLGLWTPGDALPGAPEQALAGVPRGHLPGAQWGDALIHGCRPASPRVRAVPPLGHQLGWLRADVAGGRGLRPRALPGELPAAARAFPQALAWHLEPTGLWHPQRAARWLSPPPAALPAQPPHHGPYLLALSSCGALLSSSFQPRACTSEALKGKESSDSSARISGG